MTAYYNEFDPFAAQWLRNLIAEDLIAPGDVDERSIEDVAADDLKGYTQCHFFAGIGGWSLALRLAGWSDDHAVWSGSCPCQPLSSAGKRKGHADERHLWPAFYRLIAECQPSVCFGEQVASKDGREWLAGVRADLEALGYACGAADLPAACIGALHQRHRLFFVADARGANVSRHQFEWSSIFSQSPTPPTQHRYKGLSAGLWDSADTCIAVWVDGLPRPVDVVRAYGNAIVPQVAAEFIAAYIEARE